MRGNETGTIGIVDLVTCIVMGMLKETFDIIFKERRVFTFKKGMDIDYEHLLSKIQEYNTVLQMMIMQNISFKETASYKIHTDALVNVRYPPNLRAGSRLQNMNTGDHVQWYDTNYSMWMQGVVRAHDGYVLSFSYVTGADRDSYPIPTFIRACIHEGKLKGLTMHGFYYH